MAVFLANNSNSTTSLIDFHVLKTLALETSYPDHATLSKVLTDLEHGAEIGCKPPYRVASKAINAPGLRRMALKSLTLLAAGS